MGPQRAHIVLPRSLLDEIDSTVGPRQRRAFLVETAEAELRRRRLLAFLADTTPAWRDEDHPELVEGTSTWVEAMRRSGEKRMP